MTIKELRDWLDIVTDDHDNLKVFFRTHVDMGDGYSGLVDHPIVAACIPKEKDEILFIDKKAEDFMRTIGDVPERA